jgi:hypothetical protein
MNELKINTYLRDEKGRPVPLGSVEKVRNFNDFEGHLQLDVRGVEILTAAEWDDVRDFWLIIVRMLPAVAIEGSAKTMFPSSPNSLTISLKGRGLAEISCSVDPGRRAVLSWPKLAMELGRAADEFLAKLLSLGYPEWELVPDLKILKEFGDLVGVDSWGRAR